MERLAQHSHVRCFVRSEEDMPRGWAGRVDVLKADINQKTEWAGLLDGIDIVIHLAAVAHRRNPDKRELVAVNVEGTGRLAEQAAQTGVQRFVLLSSIGVNGNSTAELPFDESMPPDPKDEYARSKLQAERVVRGLSQREGLEVTIVRPPLVYGLNAPGNFGRLVRWVRQGWPLPLGALRNQRSFIFVDNLCDFLSTVASHPAAANETYVISDGEDVSTPELVRRLAVAMDRKARLVSVPVPFLRSALALVGHSADFERLCGSLRVDSHKARVELGWTPPFGMMEALQRSVADHPIAG